MLLHRIKTLILVMATWVVFFSCICNAPTKASGYFPDVLVPCASPLDYAAPPDDVLAQAASKPPVPLFAQSFESLAKSAIARKWLPDKFDDAKYLEKGEGAYRARTAHLCKVYERAGARMTLKGFVGRLVAIMEPLPVEVTPEAREVLIKAAKNTDPCKEIYPYNKKSPEGASAAVEALFASICDAVLSPAAHSVSADHWKKEVKNVAMLKGGLSLSYLAEGPIDDPGLGTGRPAEATVTLWTNGNVLVAEVYTGRPAGTELYQELQPTDEVPMEGLRLPYVSKVAVKDEWMNAEGKLVVNREKASHQKMYIDINKGGRWRALVAYPTQAAQIGEAAWLCLAEYTVETVASCDHYPGQVGYQVKNLPSRSKALEYVANRRDLCLGALNRLEQAPFPETLAATREVVLSVLKPAKPLWGVSWPLWESALSKPEGTPVDCEAVVKAIEKEVAAKGLPKLSWGGANDAIREAQRQLGVQIDENIYN